MRASGESDLPEFTGIINPNPLRKLRPSTNFTKHQPYSHRARDRSKDPVSNVFAEPNDESLKLSPQQQQSEYVLVERYNRPERLPCYKPSAKQLTHKGHRPHFGVSKNIESETTKKHNEAVPFLLHVSEISTDDPTAQKENEKKNIHSLSPERLPKLPSQSRSVTPERPRESRVPISLTRGQKFPRVSPLGKINVENCPENQLAVEGPLHPHEGIVIRKLEAISDRSQWRRPERTGLTERGSNPRAEDRSDFINGSIAGQGLKMKQEPKKLYWRSQHLNDRVTPPKPRKISDHSSGSLESEKASAQKAAVWDDISELGEDPASAHFPVTERELQSNEHSKNFPKGYVFRSHTFHKKIIPLKQKIC